MPVDLERNDPDDVVAVYTQAEVDELLAAIKGDVYTKAQVDAFLAAATPPVEPPVVPPVVPPGTGTPIAALSDLSSAWTPKHVTPAAVNSHFKTITTPSGPGWEMICDDNDVTPWDTNNRAILARKDPTVSHLGKTELYTFDLFLPSQQLYNIWHTGLLIEWHTDKSSGHHLSLDMQTGKPRFRIGRDLGNYTYDYTYTPGVLFDQWVPVRIEIKWSTGGDGFYRVDIGGTRYVNYTGVTAVPGASVPYVQFGWYSRRGSGLTNTVRFGNLRKLVT